MEGLLLINLSALLAGFLLGSIPSAYLLGRWLGHADIRQIGSGSVGGMNALRNIGVVVGVLTILSDLAKGLGAAWIALHLSSQPLIWALTPVFLTAGHMWTPWLRGRGGKGLTVTGAYLLYLALDQRGWGVVVWLALLVVATLSFRDTDRGTVVASLSLPWAAYRAFPEAPEAGVLAGVLWTAVFVLRHIPLILHSR